MFFSLESILSIFFEKKCFSCGIKISDNNYFCKKCMDSILSIKETNGIKCENCQKNIYRSKKRRLCYRCFITDYSFEKCSSIHYYNDPIIKDLVYKFKFESNKLAGNDIISLLKGKLISAVQSLDFDILTIVPLSVISQRKRGYNQVEYILKGLNVNYDPLLRRNKHFQHQSLLNLRQRKEIIQGQFEIIPGNKHLIEDKTVLVVDDIFTTGSTAEVCGRSLLDNGAKSVEFLTFFRS